MSDGDDLAGPVDERRLVARLQAGDRAAFEQLVDRWTPVMLRVAQSYVPSASVAEEVVQDTWVGVLRGLGRFEQRASLRTWVFQILCNQAKTRGARERRSVPFATLASDEVSVPFAAVDAARFQGAGDRHPGGWAAPPPAWATGPEGRVESRETIDEIRAAIDALPPAQRTVMTLRDVVGLDAAAVCEALDLTDGNQRVLLHRARSRVRASLERTWAA